MTYVDPIGVVVGVLIALPIFWTWYEVTVGRRRRERRWLLEVRRQPGQRPAILIVDLLAGKDVRNAVESYIQSDDTLKSIPSSRIFTIQGQQWLTSEHMPEFLQRVRRVSADVLASGADVIHYFHAGPAVTAAVIGAEFANSCRVLLYQHEQGTYHSLGPMRMPG